MRERSEKVQADRVIWIEKPGSPIAIRESEPVWSGICRRLSAQPRRAIVVEVNVQRVLRFSLAVVNTT